MQLSSSEYIRLIRIIVTIIITYLITLYAQIPERIWSLITVWFVMIDYEYIGGVIHKSSLRLVGTVFSAIYGILVVYLFDNVILINMLAMSTFVFWFAHRFMDQDDSYALTIACVTVTIILFDFNDISVGLIRLFNIVIGTVISLVMMYVFHPQYAYKSLPDLILNIVMAQQNLISLIMTDADTDSFMNEKIKIEKLVLQLKTRCIEANYEIKKDIFMPSTVLTMNQVNDLISGLYWLRTYHHVSQNDLSKLKTLFSEFEKALINDEALLEPVAIHPMIDLIYKNLIGYRQLYKPSIFVDTGNAYA